MAPSAAPVLTTPPRSVPGRPGRSEEETIQPHPPEIHSTHFLHCRAKVRGLPAGPRRFAVKSSVSAWEAKRMLDDEESQPAPEIREADRAASGGPGAGWAIGDRFSWEEIRQRLLAS